MTGLRYRRVVTGLTVAGLVPMLGGALFSHVSQVVEALALYSLAILTFLCGAWWATALVSRRHDDGARIAVLVLSNIMVLALVSAMLWLSINQAMLVFALAFPLLVAGERRFAVFGRQPPYYARLRLGVSMIAAVAHTWVAATA